MQLSTLRKSNLVLFKSKKYLFEKELSINEGKDVLLSSFPNSIEEGSIYIEKEDLEFYLIKEETLLQLNFAHNCNYKDKKIFTKKESDFYYCIDNTGLYFESHFPMKYIHELQNKHFERGEEIDISNLC